MIDERVYGDKEENSASSAYAANGKLNYFAVDVPVTEGSDLSVKYQRQGTIIQTRTNVGDMIRDNGVVQRIWIAPVVDRKGDLISAHEIYAVVKKPEWIIGERTPRYVKKKLHKIPTPISKDILQEQNRVSQSEEDIIQDFTNDNKRGLRKSIKSQPKKRRRVQRRRKKVLHEDLMDLNNFGQE